MPELASLLPLRRMFVRERRGDDRRRTTYLKKHAVGHPLFSNYMAIPSQKRLPEFWNTGKNVKILGHPLWTPKAVFQLRLSGRLSADIGENTDSRRGRVVHRRKWLRLWFELEDDYLLVKLAGLDI